MKAFWALNFQNFENGGNFVSGITVSVFMPKLTLHVCYIAFDCSQAFKVKTVFGSQSTAY